MNKIISRLVPAALALGLWLQASAAAAKPEAACANHVYILDVSESMTGQCSDGKCVNVFADIKKGLADVTSWSLDLPTTVAVYTFYNRDTYESKKIFALPGPGPEVMRMVDYIKALTVTPPVEGPRLTNLYGSFSSILDDLSALPKCANNIYLLTDGLDNSPDAAVRRDEVLKKWKARRGDWLYYIDLYPGGNPEMQKLCADPDNHCSYHPVDPKDKKAVANCFCIPTISLAPSKLDFGNLLENPEAQAALYLLQNRSCLKAERNPVRFSVVAVKVADFPDPSFAAQVQPSDFGLSEAVNLSLAVNRPLEQLPRGEYHGTLVLRADDLRYLIKPAANLAFTFSARYQTATVKYPALELGKVTGPTELNFEFVFPEGPGTATLEITAAPEVKSAILTVGATLVATRDHPKLTLRLDPSALSPGDYSFELAIAPDKVDLVGPDGKPLPAKLAYSFRVPKPAWKTYLTLALVLIVLAAVLVALRALACKFLPPDNYVKGLMKDLKLCRPELTGTFEAVSGLKGEPAVVDGLFSATLGGPDAEFLVEFSPEIKIIPLRKDGRDLAKISPEASPLLKLRPKAATELIPAAGEFLYHGDRLEASGKILEYTRADSFERPSESESDDLLDSLQDLPDSDDDSANP